MRSVTLKISYNLTSEIPQLVKEEGKFVPYGKNAFKTNTIQKGDMASLIPFLVSSIKEQQLKIEKLKADFVR